MSREAGSKIHQKWKSMSSGIPKYLRCKQIEDFISSLIIIYYLEKYLTNKYK